MEYRRNSFVPFRSFRKFSLYGIIEIVLLLYIHNNYKLLLSENYIFIRKLMKKWSVEEIVSFVFDLSEILFIENNWDCSVIAYLQQL